MLISPPKFNKETSTERQGILLILTERNWIGILGDNALRLLVLFDSMSYRGEALLGDYDSISKRVGRARGSIAEGISELEAFGFLVVRKIINKKTKVYELNLDICLLDEKWINFFSNTKYKKFCINLLLGKKIKNEVIEQMNLVVANDNSHDVRKTLGRLMYLFVERKGFTIEDLLEEERTKMQEDLFPNGFGFSFGETNSESWQDILTDEEKKDKELFKVASHYTSLVDYPTRRDIDLMKKALTFCYAYQIKHVITNTKNHPKYGASFKSFQYIYNQTINGQCGTRKNNQAKKNIVDIRENGRKKPNNQTDMGFKRSGLSRTEVIQVLDEASNNDIDINSINGVEEAFDFSKLRR